MRNIFYVINITTTTNNFCPQTLKMDESVSCTEEEAPNEMKTIFELKIAEAYFEVDVSSPVDDIFDDKSFRGNFNDFLPPPSKFSRSKSMAYSLDGQTCCSGAIVSILKPHKILTVSTEFLNATVYNSSQICGRNINVLFGPKTDVSSLNSAIKNTGCGQSTTIDTVLSTSAGSDLHVTATFSPYHRPSDRSLGGCLLQIDCINCGDADSYDAVLLLDDFSMLSDATMPSPKSMQQRRQRREANLAAGLENEAERRRQQQGRISSEAAAAHR
jgi:hypothetical protein